MFYTDEFYQSNSHFLLYINYIIVNIIIGDIKFNSMNSVNNS